jgi:putative flippase GtrA
MLSLVPSYFLNSFFTFKSRNFNIRQFGSFVASYMPNFLIQLACVQLLINILHVAPLISYILAVAIAVPITFILLTTQTFTKKRG